MKKTYQKATITINVMSNKGILLESLADPQDFDNFNTDWLDGEF